MGAWKKLRCFEDYLLNLTCTEETIKELDKLISIVYTQFPCPISLDEFRDYCMDKILLRRENYDPKLDPSAGYNFLFSLFRNESYRLRGRFSRYADSEILDNQNENTEDTYIGIGDYNVSSQATSELSGKYYDWQKYQKIYYGTPLQDFPYWNQNLPEVKSFLWFSYKGPREIYMT